MSGNRRAGRRKDVSIAERLTTPASPGSPASPSGDGSVLPGGATPARSRRELREQRRKHNRKRSLTVVAVVVVLALVGALAFWWISRDQEPVAAPVEQVRTERTLTVTLGQEGEKASSGALMVADSAAGTAGSVLVPSRVFVEGPVPEGVPFGETTTIGSVGAPGTSLADTLDVIVDGTWQLSSGGLTRLVDQVGGVVVDVDVDVLAENAKGQQQIVITAGESQELNGAEAVAFAEYLGPEEPEEARLVRFGEVLDQLVRLLPPDADEVAAVLTQTDAVRQTTGSTGDVASFLVAYGDVARAGDAGYQSMPTIPLDLGGAKPASSVDPEGAAQLRETLLAGSLPPSGAASDIKVLVQNGVGSPEISEEAAALLRAEGYEYVNGGNAEPFDKEPSLILIPDTTTASIELGNAVAETLGLPESAIRTTDQGATVADVIVILGTDFNP